MLTRNTRFWTFAGLTLLCGGCLEKCAPGRVGVGVAQLTMRNVGSIITLLSEDQTCGFASELAAASLQVNGVPGAEGSMTWTVTDCVIDIPAESAHVKEDCNGVAVISYGRVKVTARRTVGGILTGDPASPIIPGGPDAVSFQIDKAELDGFRVENTSSDAALTMISGELTAKVFPRLAVAADSGACAVSTPNVHFSDVSYSAAKVHVDKGSRSFDVDVSASNLEAYNGQHEGFENYVAGTLTVWGGKQTLDGSEGLDPDYDAAVHLASYACTDNLAIPPTYECGDVLGPKLAQGAARLTILTYGNIGDRVDKDQSCGFTSPSVLAAAQIEGEVGGMGAATFTVDHCVLDFPPGSVVRTDCNGSKTIISGKAVVSGTKRLEGRLTGDVSLPVVPMRDDPARIDLVVHGFENFRVEEGGKALTLKSGSMSGHSVPRVAADTAFKGACAFETPIGRYQGVSYDTPTQAVIESPSGTFEVQIDGGALDALSGTWGSDSNLLDGNLTLNGETYGLPTDPADDGLVPGFDQAAFDASWQCGSLEMPARFDCAFVDPIAQGAAQLSVQMLGQLGDLLEGDTSCGFSSLGVLGNGSYSGVIGERGGRATWTVSSPCEVSFSAPVAAGRDCQAKTTMVSGVARITGTKTIEGILTGDPMEPIVPTSRDAVTLSVRAEVADFSVWTHPGESKLTAKSGVLSGTVKPRLALDRSAGACSIPTPVAELSSVRWESGRLAVYSEGFRFDVDVAGSALTAVNGPRDGRENYLEGSIYIDGSPMQIPVAGPPVLDPEYTRAGFDASYACTPNLQVAADDTVCDMRQTLAEGAARLMVKAAGTLASQVNANDDCGFEDLIVKATPEEVVGDAGDMGSLTWEIDGCAIQGGMDPISTDCMGNQTYMHGLAEVDARRTVSGLRETILLIMASVVPVTRDAVEIEVRNANLAGLELYDLAPGQTEPTQAIRVESGQLSAIVTPILGERASEPGTFDVPTPIAHMSQVSLRNAQVAITSDGKTFKVRVDDAQIEALNGSWGEMSMSNLIRGTITVDGRPMTIASGPLVPGYSQGAFDATYSCTDDLRALVPPAP